MRLPPPPTGAFKTWHLANCHCGALRYRILLPSLAAAAGLVSVMNCNCSLCTRNGLLNIYPLRNDIRVQLGDSEVLPGSSAFRKAKEEVLGYYVPKGAGEAHEHVFCRNCGSSVWVDIKGGQDQVPEGEVDQIALNVRMIHDIDVEDLKLQHADGKAWDPQYRS
ncbi:hypothetical protein MMC13_007247 [Lambiella insularis]|nr:hypothetical protein [Lambiella insularis]